MKFLYYFCFSVLLSSCSGRDYTKEIPPPEVPTIFFIMRGKYHERDDGIKIAKAAGRHMAYGRDEGIIIAKAAARYMGQDIGVGDVENAVIVDEGDLWFVYLGTRGNGWLQADRRGNYYVNFGGERYKGVYLDKKTLDMAVIPENGFVTGTSLFGKRIDECMIYSDKIKDVAIEKEREGEKNEKSEYQGQGK